jgi:hypothetical protein
MKSVGRGTKFVVATAAISIATAGVAWAAGTYNRAGTRVNFYPGISAGSADSYDVRGSNMNGDTRFCFDGPGSSFNTFPSSFYLNRTALPDVKKVDVNPAYRSAAQSVSLGGIDLSQTYHSHVGWSYTAVGRRVGYVRTC